MLYVDKRIQHFASKVIKKTDNKYSMQVKSDWGLPHRNIKQSLGRKWSFAHLFFLKSRPWPGIGWLRPPRSDWLPPPLFPTLPWPQNHRGPVGRALTLETVASDQRSQLIPSKLKPLPKGRALIMDEQRVSVSPVTSLPSGRSLPRQYTIDQILGNPPRETKDPRK